MRPDIKGYEARPSTVHLNAGCPGGVSEELDHAIEFWNGAPHSGLILERGYDTNYSSAVVLSVTFNEAIIIYCSGNFSGDTGGANADQILGVGFTDDFNNDSKLDKGVLVVNATVGAQASFQNADSATRELTIIHEMGHVLGLGHTTVPGAIMYYSTNGKQEVNLHQDDIDGIRHLYPQNELSGDYFLGCAKVDSQFNGTPKLSLILLLLMMLPLLLLLALHLPNQFRDLKSRRL